MPCTEKRQWSLRRRSGSNQNETFQTEQRPGRRRPGQEHLPSRQAPCRRMELLERYPPRGEGSAEGAGSESRKPRHLHPPFGSSCVRHMPANPPEYPAADNGDPEGDRKIPGNVSHQGRPIQANEGPTGSFLPVSCTDGFTDISGKSSPVAEARSNRFPSCPGCSSALETGHRRRVRSSCSEDI